MLGQQIHNALGNLASFSCNDRSLNLKGNLLSERTSDSGNKIKQKIYQSLSWQDDLSMSPNNLSTMILKYTNDTISDFKSRYPIECEEA